MTRSKPKVIADPMAPGGQKLKIKVDFASKDPKKRAEDALTRAEEDYLRAHGWIQKDKRWTPKTRVSSVFPGDKVMREEAVKNQRLENVGVTFQMLHPEA